MMVECVQCGYEYDLTVKGSAKHLCGLPMRQKYKFDNKSRTIRPVTAVVLDHTGQPSKTYMQVSGEVAVTIVKAHGINKFYVTLKGPTEDITIYCKEFTLGAPEDL